MWRRKVSQPSTDVSLPLTTNNETANEIIMKWRVKDASGVKYAGRVSLFRSCTSECLSLLTALRREDWMRKTGR